MGFILATVCGLEPPELFRGIHSRDSLWLRATRIVSYPRGLCVHVCFRSVEVLRKDYGFKRIAFQRLNLKWLFQIVVSPEIQMFIERFASDYKML